MPQKCSSTAPQRWCSLSPYRLTPIRISAKRSTWWTKRTVRLTARGNWCPTSKSCGCAIWNRNAIWLWPSTLGWRRWISRLLVPASKKRWPPAILRRALALPAADRCCRARWWKGCRWWCSTCRTLTWTSSAWSRNRWPRSSASGSTAARSATGSQTSCWRWPIWSTPGDLTLIRRVIPGKNCCCRWKISRRYSSLASTLRWWILRGNTATVTPQRCLPWATSAYRCTATTASLTCSPKAWKTAPPSRQWNWRC